MLNSEIQHSVLANLSAKQILAIAAVLLVTTIVYQFVYALLLSLLKDIPGPFLARFTRLWELRQMIRGDSHETFVDLHKKHGPVVRISPNLFSFNSPADQKKIYNLRADLLKTPYYSAGGHPQRVNLFSTQDAALHSDRKKVLANLYSMSSMVHYEDAVDRMNKICLRKYAEFAEKRKKVLVPEFMQAYAFDVIGEITINKNFGMMENEGDVDGMMELVQSSIRYQGTVGILPEFHSWIVRVGNFLRLPNAGSVIEKLANDTISKFRQPESQIISKENPNSDPFISKLLRLEAAGKADWYNIMDAIGGNIAAGSDTTAITLSAALYYLYRTPRALTALRKEIDEMEKDGRISDPVSFKEAQDMSYLQAVIQETLRLHPAVGYVLPRKVPVGGMELAGRWFPEGTNVGVSAWALHQNPEVYGDDASEFRPERFLGSEGGSKNQTASLASSFAFGGGTRTCIGKNISLLEMTKVLPQIVRKFDLVFESEEPWELYTTWFVWQKYYCYIEPRKS